ncbi:MAG: hypothetical protein KDD21_11685 [Bacteroidetes bacterium]|nr:hypothetical protein [Bacteroidota bacterium]
MKSIKITSIIIALIAIFTACKKENITKQTEPKDYITTNMKMNYYGKILEYTVKYSPSTDIRKVEGKDAIEAQKIVDSYPNSVTVFDTKNEVHFFRDKLDYYYYISTLNKNTLANRQIASNSGNLGYSRQNTDFWFYRDANTSNLIISDNINTMYTSAQTFMLRQPCNDGTNNSCPTYSMSLIGKRVNWVGGSNNDCISSIRLRNYQYNTFAGVVTITLFQDADYGGKAIAFYFPQYIYTYDQTVNHLSDYKINSLLKTWNDRTSSYECFYPWP